MQAGFAGLGYDTRASMHCHPNFEVHYIEEGECFFRYDEKLYELEKDTLVLIPAKVYHSFEKKQDPSKKTSFEIRLSRAKGGKGLYDEYERLFSSISSPMTVRGFLPEMINLSTARGVIRGDEAISRINASFTMVFLRICDILRFNCDTFEKTEENSTAELCPDDEDVTLIKILNYISSNATEPIRISDLASHVSLSQRQIQRILSQRMNDGFHSILTRNRIAIAKSIISESPEKSLESVAYESGFTNYVSCWNQFKRLTGQTPEEYKKRRI